MILSARCSQQYEPGTAPDTLQRPDVDALESEGVLLEPDNPERYYSVGTE